jgi:hypothetical protein
MNLLYNATNIPSALMGSALNEQDMLCRIFGECQAGDPIDREVKTLIGSHGPLIEKLFTYVRYNAELSRGGLNAMGCGNIDPSAVQKMDSTDSICQLQEVGRAVRERKVRLAHLRPEIFAP